MRRRFRAEKIAAVLSRILFLLFEDDGIAASYLPDFVIFRCFLAITEGIGYCQLDVLTIGGIVICLVVDVVSRVYARGIADKRFSERTSERKTNVQSVPRPCPVQVVVGRIPLVRYGRMVNAGCGISGGNPMPSDANFLSHGVGISVVRLPSITTVFALTSSSSRSTAVFSVVSLAVAATLSFGNPVPLPDTVPDTGAADRLIAATHNVMIEVLMISSV